MFIKEKLFRSSIAMYVKTSLSLDQSSGLTLHPLTWTPINMTIYQIFLAHWWLQ